MISIKEEYIRCLVLFTICMTVPIVFFAEYTPLLIQQGIEIQAGKGKEINCTVITIETPHELNVFGYNYSYRNITYFVTSQQNLVFSQSIPTSLNFTVRGGEGSNENQYLCYSQNYQNQYVALWQRTQYDTGVVAYIITATVLTVFFILLTIFIFCYISRKRNKIENLDIRQNYSLDQTVIKL